jgi:hypothetical protein
MLTLCKVKEVIITSDVDELATARDRGAYCGSFCQVPSPSRTTSKAPTVILRARTGFRGGGGMWHDDQSEDTSFTQISLEVHHIPRTPMGWIFQFL